MDADFLCRGLRLGPATPRVTPARLLAASHWASRRRSFGHLPLLLAQPFGSLLNRGSRRRLRSNDSLDAPRAVRIPKNAVGSRIHGTNTLITGTIPASQSKPTAILRIPSQAPFTPPIGLESTAPASAPLPVDTLPREVTHAADGAAWQSPNTAAWNPVSVHLKRSLSPLAYARLARELTAHRGLRLAERLQRQSLGPHEQPSQLDDESSSIEDLVLAVAGESRDPFPSTEGVTDQRGQTAESEAGEPAPFTAPRKDGRDAVPNDPDGRRELYLSAVAGANLQTSLQRAGQLSPSQDLSERLATLTHLLTSELRTYKGHENPVQQRLALAEGCNLAAARAVVDGCTDLLAAMRRPGFVTHCDSSRLAIMVVDLLAGVVAPAQLRAITNAVLGSSAEGEPQLLAQLLRLVRSVPGTAVEERRRIAILEAIAARWTVPAWDLTT